MKKYLVFVLPFFLLALTHCKGGVSSGKTLAKINNKKITEGDLEFLGSINPGIRNQLATPFGKKQLLDNLIEQELLYQASSKKGVQNDPKVQAKIDLYRKVIIAQEFVEKEAKEEAKKYYEEHKKEFEKLGLSHIMIGFATAEDLKQTPGLKKRSEQEALALATKLRTRLDKGENFADLAKEASDDLLSKPRGGDLGRVSQEETTLVRRGFAPLLEKAFTLKVGEVAGPIKTDKGYHLLIVTSPLEQKMFEEVEGQLAVQRRMEVRSKLLVSLKEKAKIRNYLEESQTRPAVPGETLAPPPEDHPPSENTNNN